MAIDSLDELLSGLAASRRNNLYKASLTNAAGGFVSLWTAAGNPSAGAVPPLFSAGGGIPAKGDAGTIPFGASPQPGNGLYLGRLQLSSSSTGTFILYDRLWSCSGMSGTVTTAQVIAPAPTLQRVGDFNQVEAWMEAYSALGATTTTATLSYTNEDGVAGRAATLTTIASWPVNRMLRFVLQGDDTGIQSVASVTLTASTGTAGNFGVTLLRRIAEVPITLANINTVLDAMALGLPTVDENAALALMNLSTTTSSGTLLGSLDVIEG